MGVGTFFLVPSFVPPPITQAQDGPYLISVVYCELEAHEGDQVGDNFGKPVAIGTALL